MELISNTVSLLNSAVPSCALFSYHIMSLCMYVGAYVRRWYVELKRILVNLGLLSFLFLFPFLPLSLSLPFFSKDKTYSDICISF